jgi:hypothetical protein
VNTHREQHNANKRLWGKNNPDRISRYTAKQYSKHKNKMINDMRVRRHTDLNYKLKIVLRNRLKAAIKNSQKTGSAVRDLGCSIDFLKTHLESKFQPGMSWGNYGFDGWHIDHIIPLSAFNLTDREQLLKACHYTNLQPLWKDDNFDKGSKIL